MNTYEPHVDGHVKVRLGRFPDLKNLLWFAGSPATYGYKSKAKLFYLDQKFLNEFFRS